MLEILRSANGRVVSKWVESRRGRNSGVAIPASFGNIRSNHLILELEDVTPVESRCSEASRAPRSTWHQARELSGLYP